MDRGFGFGPHGRGAGRGQAGNDGVPYGVPPAGAPFGLDIVEPRQVGRGGALRPNPLHHDNADADPLLANVDAPIVGGAADPLAPLAPQLAQPAPARELDFERDVIEDDYAEEEPVQGAAQAAVPDIQALLRELAALRAAVEARPGGAPAVAYGVAPAAPVAAPAAPLALVPRVVSASEMLTLRKAVPKFDGKISYEAYRASFDDLVSMYPHLTEDQRFQLLSSGLVGAPLSLLEDLASNRTFAGLDEALRLSYSKPIHAWTEMNNLSSMRQDPSESLEEWSTRVSRTARRAFPDMSLARVEEFAVQYFFTGLSSAQIKSCVSGLACTSMQAALDACRLVRSRLAPPGPAAKRVCLASVAEATVEVASPGPSSAPAPPVSAASAAPAAPAPGPS
ncbi:hypothetical protein KUF71_012391 [Frankliniella fusca]|uniref:Uncharacterized protein n=1 Tax=Frankliniella fusca TaxID=407009 RepID=A0AAE1I319_9NEOP|nr:hypothetical protein KUF71_012391 [Frankliniella fusca]